jgi:hypothetical protein
LSDLNEPTRGEVEATKTAARLPGLDIEIVHRRSPDGDAEHISINLRAAPSFAAFARLLAAANPFAFWAEAARLTWLPWLEAARLTGLSRALGPVLPPAGLQPRSGSGEEHGSSE